MKPRLSFSCLLAVLSFYSTISAQDRGQVNPEAVEQVIVRGSRRMPEKEMKSYIGTRRGSLFDPAQLDKDVHDLYATGHFEDVKVFAEDGNEGGKIVTFEVREWPLITTASYKGLDAERESALRAELKRQGIDIPSGSEYNPVRINEVARAIKPFLEANGYSSSKVTPVIEPVSNQEIAVTFKIEEAGRPTASIELTGNTHVSSEELMKDEKAGDNAEEPKTNLDRIRSSPSQVQVETIALPGMPIRIDSAILGNVDGKNWLWYRVTNLGDEQINRIKMWLVSYSTDGISTLQFSLSDCRLAAASAVESTQQIDRDLPQITRAFLVVDLAQSFDYFWFLDGQAHSRFQEELSGMVGFSLPDVSSCAVTKKAARPGVKDLPAPYSQPTADDISTDTRPLLLNMPPLLYTEEARKYHVQGVVRLQVLVAEDGEVKQVKVVSGLPDGLNEEAINCATKMRFSPAMKNGQAVPYLQAVDIEFNLR